MCGADRCSGGGISCRISGTSSWLSRTFPSLLIFPNRSLIYTSTNKDTSSDSDKDRDKDQHGDNNLLSSSLFQTGPSPPKRMKLDTDNHVDANHDSASFSNILLAGCLFVPQSSSSTLPALSGGGLDGASRKRRKNSAVYRDLNAVAPISF